MQLFDAHTSFRLVGPRVVTQRAFDGRRLVLLAVPVLRASADRHRGLIFLRDLVATPSHAML